jgi:hypothetical protein
MRPVRFDLVAHLERQRQFSFHTFGPGARTAMVINHIRKELIEVEAAPFDLEEWVDVILLALDGAWRTGARPEQIVAAIQAKQATNEGRQWPDWRTSDPDKAIEHVPPGNYPGAPPSRPECQFVSCGTPYICRLGCRHTTPIAREVVAS